MAYKPKTLIVPEGGTGIVTATAYSPICGGTTSTGNLQSLASAGTSGQALTSNGAGALPSYQNIASGGSSTYSLVTTVSGDPADSTTYYLLNGSTSVDVNGSFIVIAKTGTITLARGLAQVNGTLASAGNSTIFIEKNGGATTNITTTLALTSAQNNYSNTGLSIAVTAGDYLRIGWTTPAWATNPTNVFHSITIVVT
jgi:hypothetical protein